MEHTTSICLAFITGIAFTTLISWNDRSDVNQAKVNANPDNNSIIALWKVKPKTGIATEAFEKWAAKLANNEYGVMPGIKQYFAKVDRGDNVGEYIYVVVEFDSKAPRNFYYPEADSDSSVNTPEPVKKLYDLYF